MQASKRPGIPIMDIIIAIMILWTMTLTTWWVIRG